MSDLPQEEDLIARLALVEGALGMPRQSLTRNPQRSLAQVSPRIRGRWASAWTGDGSVGFWHMFKMLLRAAGGGSGQNPQNLLRGFGRWLSTRDINPFDVPPRSLLPQIQAFLVGAPAEGRVAREVLANTMAAGLGTFALLSAAEGFLGLDPGQLVRMPPRQAIAEAQKRGVNINPTEGGSLASKLSRMLDKITSTIHAAVSGEDLFQDMVVGSTSPTTPKRARVFYSIGESLRHKGSDFAPSVIMSMAANSGKQRALDQAKRKPTTSLDAPLGDGSRSSLLDTLADDQDLDQIFQGNPTSKLREVAEHVVEAIKNQDMKRALDLWLDGKTLPEIMAEMGSAITLGSLKTTQSRVRSKIREMIHKDPKLLQEFRDLM